MHGIWTLLTSSILYTNYCSATHTSRHSSKQISVWWKLKWCYLSYVQVFRILSLVQSQMSREWLVGRLVQHHLPITGDQFDWDGSALFSDMISFYPLKMWMCPISLWCGSNCMVFPRSHLSFLMSCCKKKID